MTTPAGWYPDTEVPGGTRYWDGATWTEHRQPAGASRPSGANAPGIASFWIGLAALLLSIIPFFIFGTWIPAMIALIGGFIGLAQHGKRKVGATLGLIFGVAALMVGGGVTANAIWSAAIDVVTP